VRWWLVRDAVLRQLYAILIAVLLLTFFWTEVARHRLMGVAVIGSMIATHQLGLLTATAMEVREVRLRPVSRTALWQATWILSVIVAPLTAALGKLVGGYATWMGNGDVDAWLSLASLSSLYDVLFGGVMLGAQVLMRSMPTPRSRSLKRVVIEVFPFAYLLLLLPGGLLLPVLAYHYLPHAWTAMTWSSGLFLLGAAVVGLAAWFGTEPPAQPGFARLHLFRGSRVSAPARSGSLTGWRILVWLELRFLLTILTLMAIAAIVAGPTLRMFRPTASIPEMTGAIVRFFFNPAPGKEFSLYVLAAAIIGVMATSNLLQPMLRQLRALPVSRFRLTAILLLLPVAHVVVVWILLALLFVLSEHAFPAVLRIEIFALAVGLAMFSQSFQMRFPLRGLQFSTALVAPALMVAWSAAGGGDEYDRVAIFAAGVTTLCVVLGATLTLRSLNRAATYRADASLSPWGVPPPTGNA